MSNNAKFNKCPYCKSENIMSDGEAVGCDGRWTSNFVSCIECEQEWEEVYEVTSRFDMDGKELHD